MSKDPSFEKINYILRPKKQIERKIIIEILNKLQRAGNINFNEYHYIGMGSVYYYDYLLFHKYLDIHNMTSIDNKNTKKRFEFNKPYDFIVFENKETTSFLESYHFKNNNFIWFDYDSKLVDDEVYQVNEYIKIDTEILIKNSKLNDLFLITIDAKFIDDIRLKKIFYEYYGDYISKEYKSREDYYTELNYRYLLQNILLNIIEDTQKLKDFRFHKLFSFYYKDGTPMYTLGGIFMEVDSYKKNIAVLENETFYNNDHKHIFDINVPILTYKEKLFLDSNIRKLKKIILDIANVESIEKELINNYYQICSPQKMHNYLQYYKYYPQYYEGIV